jgi:hypothetical protein
MIIKKVDILSVKIVSLSFLFIFGVITQVKADSFKSINNTVNQETITKMNENEISTRKNLRPAKDPDESLKKRRAKFQSGPFHDTDGGKLMSMEKFDVNLLKIAEEKKKPLLSESLDQVIYFDKFAQQGGRGKFLTFQEVTKTNSPNSDFGQFVLRPYQYGTNYLEEEKTSGRLKLLQFKREEIFREIFLGFRFSFTPMVGHIFLEMNGIPSSEKRPSIMIPF